MAGAHRSSRPDTEATRDAILDAASTLFAERGYLATTVDDIAVAAHVAAGTVYTSVGDKQQLLEAVVHRFVEPEPEVPGSPIPQPLDAPVLDDAPAPDVTVRLSPEEVAASVDPRSVIRETVHANRLATEAFADFYDLIHRNGTMDGTVAGSATAADDRMRRAANQLATQLADLNALRTTAAQAVDLLAYFLGYLSWRRLVHDFGWSYDNAEAWLADRIGEALLIVEG
jgi:AcrR family transcriptional regulator